MEFIHNSSYQLIKQFIIYFYFFEANFYFPNLLVYFHYSIRYFSFVFLFCYFLNELSLLISLFFHLFFSHSFQRSNGIAHCFCEWKSQKGALVHLSKYKFQSRKSNKLFNEFDRLTLCECLAFSFSVFLFSLLIFQIPFVHSPAYFGWASRQGWIWMGCMRDVRKGKKETEKMLGERIERFYNFKYSINIL